MNLPLIIFSNFILFFWSLTNFCLSFFFCLLFLWRDLELKYPLLGFSGLLGLWGKFMRRPSLWLWLLARILFWFTFRTPLILSSLLLLLIKREGFKEFYRESLEFLDKYFEFLVLSELWPKICTVLLVLELCWVLSVRLFSSKSLEVSKTERDLCSSLLCSWILLNFRDF